MAPRISPETRLNRFQAFLVVTTFMVAHAPYIEMALDDLLESRGIDPQTLAALGPAAATEGPGAALASLGSAGMAAADRVGEWLVPAAHAQAVPTVPPNAVEDDPAGLDDALSAVWKKVATANFAVDVGVSTLVGAAVQVGIKAALAYSAGSTGGVIGALGATSVVGALYSGLITNIFTKLAVIAAVELNVLSYEPDPPGAITSAGFQDVGGERRFVIEFLRSRDEEIGVTAFDSVGGVLNIVDGVDATKFNHTYQLVRFPDCATTELGAPGVEVVKDARLRPVFRKDAEGNPTERQDPSKLAFVLPPSAVRPGPNFFRMATFQYYGNAELPIDTARARYSFADLGIQVGPIDPNSVYQAAKLDLAKGMVYDAPPAVAAATAQTLKLASDVRLAQLLLLTDPEIDRLETQRSALRNQIDDVDTAIRDISLPADSQARFDKRNRLLNFIEEARRGPGGRPDVWRNPGSAASVRAAEILDGPLDTATAGAIERLQVRANAWEADQVFIDRQAGALDTLRLGRGNTPAGDLIEYVATDSQGLPVRRQFEQRIDGRLRNTATDEIFEFQDVIDDEEFRLQNGLASQRSNEALMLAHIDEIDQRVLGDSIQDFGGVRERLDDNLIRARQAEVEVLEARRAAVRAEIGDVEEGLVRVRARGDAIDRAGVDALSGRTRWARTTRALATPAGRGLLNLAGSAFDYVDFQNKVRERIGLISSPLSSCAMLDGSDRSGLGSPIETSPEFGIDGVLVPVAFADPARRREGNLEIRYPWFDAPPRSDRLGFPTQLITTDSQGYIYAENANSSFNYGGRIFRYRRSSETSGLTREFIGSVNYFSLALQYGRPASPVAMEAGDWRDDATATVWEDVFVADIDYLFDAANPRKRIMRVPVHLAEEFPVAYSASNGQRIRLAGRPFASDPRFAFTGPSDLEVPPPVTEDRSVPRTLYLSDESAIFAIDQPPGSPTGVVTRIVSVPGRRFSGLAFDLAGNLFLADFNSGEIFLLSAAELAFAQGGDEIVGEEALQARATLIKEGLDAPFDIEIDRLYDRTIVSTDSGIEFFHLPVVGRYGPDVREIRLKSLSKELPVTLRPNGDGSGGRFVAGMTFENLFGQEAVLLVRRQASPADPASWDRVDVRLSPIGATVLEGEL